MADALIIGAGISGLSCAWTLGKLGVEATVVESGDRAGGVMQTHRVGGYVIEGGPTTLLPRPETLEFIEELQLSPQLVKPGGSRYVYAGGRLRKVPLGAISPAGLLRILAEPAIRSRSPEDESVFDFFRRRMGREAADLVSTAVMGIYAGDTRALSAAAAFPRMVELERKYGSVILGMVRSRQRGKARSTGSATFKDGFETLANTIARQVNVRLGVSEVRLSDAKAVVVAAPAHRAAAVLERGHSSLARLLQSVEYAPMIVAAAAVPDESFPEPLRGFGFLVPRSESMHTLGSIFTSALFPDRAPKGMQLLSSFMGGAFEPEVIGWPDDRVWDTVGGELKRILRISSFPQSVLLIRHERALAQYKIGHERFVGAVRDELKGTPGLFLTGNYLAGAGVADCIEQGQQTARAVAEYLRRKP